MKRITSLLLAVLMVLSLFSATAFAADSSYVDAAAAVEDGVVEVTLTSVQESTNATVALGYDPQCLEYLDAEVAGTASTAAAKNGTVTLGYAVSDSEPLAAGTVIAKVRFAVIGRWEETEVTVTTVNFGEDTGINAPEEALTVVSGMNLTVGSFEDVEPGAWYYDAVDFVVSEGLFKGLTETTFGPDVTMDRAMFVTVLGRMAGVEQEEGDHPFTDVKAGSYYAGYVAWGAENGIVKGMTATIFAPKLDVTREQMATFLYRFAQYLGEDVSDVDEDALAAFADAGDVHGYALEAMTWAVSEGLIQGTGAGLEPQATATRAQAAMVLYRLAGLLAK